MTDFTLRQLSHFLAIAEHGTISAAARELNFSASALSGSLDELERALGAQLFVRRKAHGVVLTADGRQVRRLAAELIGRARELQAAVGEDAGTLSGPIRVGCYPTLAPAILPPLLDGFARAHPAVTVDYVEAGGDELQAAVGDGELDLAIMYDRDVVGDVEVLPLFTTRPYVLVAADHRLAGADRVTLTELIAEPLVLFDLPPSRQHTLSLFSAAGLVPRMAHRSSNVELVRALVARGLGWAVLVQRLPDAGGAQQAVAVKKLSPPAPEVRVVVIRARRRVSLRAGEFARFAAELAKAGQGPGAAGASG